MQKPTVVSDCISPNGKLELDDVCECQRVLIECSIPRIMRSQFPWFRAKSYIHNKTKQNDICVRILL